MKRGKRNKGQRGVGYCLVSPLQNGLRGRPLPSRIRESICKKYLAVFLRENEDKPRVSSSWTYSWNFATNGRGISMKREVEQLPAKLRKPRFFFKVCVWKVFVEIKSIQEKGACLIVHQIVYSMTKKASRWAIYVTNSALQWMLPSQSKI